MEALEGFQDKFKYDIIGHSGEGPAVTIVNADNIPKNEKERLNVLQVSKKGLGFCKKKNSEN